MAKSSKQSVRTKTGSTSRTPIATSGDSMEGRVVAFAEQLGRIAGTIQGKAEGWTDRERLTKRLADVRDGAAHLLEQLTTRAKPDEARKGDALKKSRAATSRHGAQGRSGGLVDAPGKQHRKQGPADPDANKAASQAAKLRAAKPMAKTDRRRARG